MAGGRARARRRRGLSAGVAGRMAVAEAGPPVSAPGVMAELVDAIGADATVEVVAAFRIGAAEGVRATLDALARGDLAEAGRVAHAQKSSAALVGALALSTTMALIELAARAADRATADLAAARLPALLEESLAALEATLGAATG